MKSKDYSEKRLNPNTEKYSLEERKKYVSFNAYDLEEAFEEGQRNSAWIYNEDPKPGVKVLADDLYLGPIIAKVNEEGDWITEDGKNCNVDRWCPLPA